VVDGNAACCWWWRIVNRWLLELSAETAGGLPVGGDHQQMFRLITKAVVVQ
jgi:hypothetical protein